MHVRACAHVRAHVCIFTYLHIHIYYFTKVGVIILYDHVHPVGAFSKNSEIDVSTSSFQFPV